MLDIKAAREELTGLRAELKARQDKVSRHTRHREDPLPQDFAEQAVELENGETLVALDQELAQELRKIDHALERIDAGNYLTCESCEEPIGEERLKALPYSSLCIDCASDAAERA
ncbi:MAG: TraR/DksA family transcriptional regulator [Pseudomonadales bacterium]|jgi:RNA polymerase-binding protein DksA